MRGAVHCLGVSLLLTGSFGLMCMLMATVEQVGRNLRLLPAPGTVAVGPSENPRLLTQIAHERVPFAIHR